MTLRSFLHGAALRSLSGIGLTRWYRTRDKNRGSVLVLCYHRVNDEHDPFWPAVTVNDFRQQMAFLATHYELLPVERALFSPVSGRAKGPRVIVTFDDGFLDNWTCAWPILRQLGIPSIFFVTTGFIDRKRRPWPDHVRLLVANSAKTEVSILGRTFSLTSLDRRVEAARGMNALLLPLMPEAREQHLHALEEDLGCPPAEMPAMTWEHLALMAEQGAVIGAHSETHPSLRGTDRELQFWELSRSRDRIGQCLKRPTDYLAYPFGHYDQTTIALAKEVGFRAAFSTVPGLYQREVHSAWEIPRFHTTNEPISYFDARVGGAEAALRNLLRPLGLLRT